MTASSRLNWAERQSKVAGLDESVNMGRAYEIGFEVFGKFCYGVYGVHCWASGVADDRLHLDVPDALIDLRGVPLTITLQNCILRPLSPGSVDSGTQFLLWRDSIARSHLDMSPEKTE